MLCHIRYLPLQRMIDRDSASMDCGRPNAHHVPKDVHGDLKNVRLHATVQTFLESSERRHGRRHDNHGTGGARQAPS